MCGGCCVLQRVVVPECVVLFVSYFSICGASNFPFKIPAKSASIFFFSLWRRDPVLELHFPTPSRVVLLCFTIQCLQMAL